LADLQQENPELNLRDRSDAPFLNELKNSNGLPDIHFRKKMSLDFDLSTLVLVGVCRASILGAAVRFRCSLQVAIGKKVAHPHQVGGGGREGESPTGSRD
jgi:hypothetical protein